MSEDCARLLWRPGQHGAEAESTGSSTNRSCRSISIKGLSSKKNLVLFQWLFITITALRAEHSMKGLLGFFFLFCFLTFGSYPYCPQDLTCLLHSAEREEQTAQKEKH